MLTSRVPIAGTRKVDNRIIVKANYGRLLVEGTIRQTMDSAS